MNTAAAAAAAQRNEIYWSKLRLGVAANSLDAQNEIRSIFLHVSKHYYYVIHFFLFALRLRVFSDHTSLFSFVSKFFSRRPTATLYLSNATAQ